MNTEAQVLSHPLQWLRESIDRHFFCVLGPPQAYFEINEDITRDDSMILRVVYQTFAVVAQEDTPESRKILVGWVWDQVFKPTLEIIYNKNPEHMPGDLLLFWRKKPLFFEAPNGAVGLRMRLAVPGFRLPGEVKL